MKARAVHYKVNGMEFLRVEGNKRNKPYTLKFLEKLAGFELEDNAPYILHRYGFIRVCMDDHSYRK